MYFSRVALSSELLQTKDAFKLTGNGIYRAHQLLWQLFSAGKGEDRNLARPFIFREVEDSKWPLFYLISSARPEHSDGCWAVETKTFSPKIATGSRLSFEVRVNPVIKQTVPVGDKSKQVRHDIVMHSLKHRPEQDESSRSEIEREAAMKWLENRCERFGFVPLKDYFGASGYRQHRLPRRNRPPIRFSTLDLSGVLEVTDPARFREALFGGIGPSKSFGCGLLLVRAS